jgi:hypothetical protein
MNFLKNNKYFLIGLLVLAWVVFVNLFPKGYILTSTDTPQIVNIQDNYSYYVYTFPARLLYLEALRILSLFDNNDTLNLSSTLGFFIFGSYLSFYLFSKLLFKASDFIRSSFSLIYALNVVTLLFFTMHGLGYICFFYLYIFIPLLVGLFIRFLVSGRFHFLALFCLCLFCASPGFGNPAFALSLALVLFVLMVLLVALRVIPVNWKLVFNVTLLAVGSFLVSAFWILCVVPTMRSGVENINTINEIDLVSALIGSGNAIADSFGLHNSSHNYFPFNFQYESLNILRYFFIFLSYTPLLLIGLYAIFVKKFEKKKLFYVALAIFLLLVLGVAKMMPPFEVLNYFVFMKTWGLNTLRASDKFEIFMPFFLIVPLFIAFNNLEKGSKYRKSLYVAVFLLIITPLPFFLGKLQQNVGARLSSGETYQTSKLTFLVKVPSEYYAIKPLFDRQQGDFFIATLPNNMGWSGTGSSNYPKWKMNGIDVTQLIYARKFIEPNQPSFRNWIFAKELENTGTPDWIVQTLGMMNAKFIIFHKDAPDGVVEKTLPKMNDLESRGLIVKVRENDYFNLYEISKEYVLPYVSWQNEGASVEGNITSLERNVAKVVDDTFPAEYQKINPKKFVVNLPDGATGKRIVLAEKFDPLWKAYAVDRNGKETEISNHSVARGYANGWTVDDSNDISSIVIEYYPTRLMWYGIGISGITVLLLVVYLIRYVIRRRREKNVIQNRAED